MKTKGLLDLLHLSDSSFPTGTFGHSFGLEYMITHKWIKGLDDLLDFSKEVLDHSLVLGDRIFIILSFQAAKNRNFQRIKELDELSMAFKPSVSIRQASAQIGRSFLSLAAEVFEKDSMRALKIFFEKSEKHCHVQHSIAWGAVGGLMTLDLDDLLLSYLSGFFRQWAQVGIRILPLGQKDSQIYLYKMNQYIMSNKKLLIKDVSEDDLYQCTFNYDLAQMGHESLNARYFRS